MLHELLSSNIAIVGGGKFCHTFLKFIREMDSELPRPAVLGVADKNETASGIRFARESGLYTTSDFNDLLEIRELQVILELTKDRPLVERIRSRMPRHLRLIDHFEVRGIWDVLQIEDVRLKALRELKQNRNDPENIERLFERITGQYRDIIRQRGKWSYQKEMELVEHERTLTQIIQGSTIPTFVINRDHIITHWNRAMENFSGMYSEAVVGTRKQWAPFYEKERHTMADVILDQIGADEIADLYGSKWRRSALIEDAYEAEDFFPKLGESGKWCWFTAAPIKAPDGTIIGAIETLWDKTEDKKSEEEKERHTQELAALCSIYTDLSAPQSLNNRINDVIRDIKEFLSAESICIYLNVEDALFHIKYRFGTSDDRCRRNLLPGEDGIVREVIESDEMRTYENLTAKGNDGSECASGLKSIAYIPISAKEKKAFGIIRIGSCRIRHFNDEEKNVLELIGNRIGVAIENAMLQEQYIKSEEKYRSLFNNDPNPIFIVDRDNFKILDTNQRAQDCYGFRRLDLVGLPFFSLGESDDYEVKDKLKNLPPFASVLISKKRHFKKDGSGFFVNINISQSKYGERDVLIITTTDITETIEKEIQLIQAGKMATLGLMAAGMAHEINQPLNVIHICADFFLKMLKKGLPVEDADIKSMAEDIVANVRRASNVIQHVRDFARQSEIVRNRVNINDPISDVFKILGHQIKVHDIDVKMRLADDLPPVMAEHNRLEQVFVNLVSNAIDAMDEKREKFPECKDAPKRLTIKSFAENGRVVVTVTDTGVGIPEAVKSKIFEPFFTTKKTGKGTGLGVSISYGIVRDYHGKIDIESEAGKGTTFRLTFPAVD